LPIWNHQTARAFHEHNGVSGRQLPVTCTNSAEVDACVFQSRRNARRERVPKMDRVDHIEGLLVLHDGRVDFGVVSSTRAARNRLECGGTYAATTQLGQQRRGDMRFPNTSVGSGNEKSRAHVFFSDPHAPATASTANKGVMGTRYRLYDTGPPASATKYNSRIPGSSAECPSFQTPTVLRTSTTSNATLYRGGHQRDGGSGLSNEGSKVRCPGPSRSLPQPNAASFNVISGADNKIRRDVCREFCNRFENESRSSKNS